MDREKQIVLGVLIVGLSLTLLLLRVARAIPSLKQNIDINQGTILPHTTYLPVMQKGGVRFAVIGDYGYAGAGARSAADMIESWHPDFIITLGDNNYPLGEAATIDANIGQYYSQYIYPYGGAHPPGSAPNQFFPALGNHDWGTGDIQPYLDYFPISSSVANLGSSGNERYYDFVQGPVHFFVVDSDDHEPDGNEVNSVQADWLQTQVAASTTPWQIVIFHHPPYSSSLHGSNTVMQWPFADWGVDAVMSGHDHTYERLIVNDLLYFVNGLGGRSIYGFGMPVPGSQVRYNGDFGAMLVDADDAFISYSFYSVANGGTLIDDYTNLGDGTSCNGLQTLIPAGAVWKYWDESTGVAEQWREPTFNDDAWASGPAILGFGDAQLTQLNVGNITYYFRHAFSAASAAQFDNLLLEVLRDDGAVVYLNESEVWRTNMPDGMVDSATLAPAVVGGADETTFYTTTISPTTLLSGTNYLAVEVHQHSLTSSDISLDLQLRGQSRDCEGG